MRLLDNAILFVVLLNYCYGWKVVDRNSEERNEEFKKEREKYNLDNMNGLNSFHVDKDIEGKHKTVIIADCLDIDIGPLAKRSLRFIFELANISWTIDSVATSSKYVGKPMTKRMADFLRSRNQALSGHRVKVISEEDFKRADWILAIDQLTLDYINKIKPKDCNATIELWENYDFYKDGDPKLLNIDNFKSQTEYIESYHHNLRMALMFLGNIRCRKCFPHDLKVSESYWDDQK